MKRFNVTGLCIPEKHYMADISRRIQEITERFVDEGQYFAINRARQYGKTTTLYMLEKYLQKRYIVIGISFEAADDLFTSLYALTTGLIRRIGKRLTGQIQDKCILDVWNSPVSREFPLEDFSDKITELCTKCGRKVILMIDAVDKSSDNQIFLSFLGLLRSKYLEQQKGQDCTFHSVILAGVYDVKNLKLKLHPQEESKYNSPWNIAADFNVEMALTADEIISMLTEYEKDHHTGMNIDEVAGFLYDYTSGYPYLVSRICQLVDEKLPYMESFASGKSPWCERGVSEAVKFFMKESNTLFDDLRKSLNDYPELAGIIREILFAGKSFPYNPDNHAIDAAAMFGFIKESGGMIAISNRIFETRLYNYFLSEDLFNNKTYEAGLQAKNQFIKGGDLDMDLVLHKFMEQSGDKTIVEVVV